MSLQERHQTFRGIIETGGIPFDYYKPFAPPQFACTQPVRLMDIGCKDASRGAYAST